MLRIFLPAVALSLLLSGCGLKGPLYLPEDENAQAQGAAADNNTAVPEEQGASEADSAANETDAQAPKRQDNSGAADSGAADSDATGAKGNL